MRIAVVWLIVTTLIVQGASLLAQEHKNLRLVRGHGFPDAEGIKRVHALHMAGLAHDRAQLPALLQVVNQPRDGADFYMAVHALARIGDMQALPALEAALNDLEDSETRGYVEVARARLLAGQEAGKHAAPRDRAQAQLNAFLTTLQLNADQINTGTARNLRHLQENGGESYTRETYALRELADMIYLHRDAALAEAAKTAGIDFNIDSGARYKAQLALLTSQQRVDWLVHVLSQKNSGDDVYLLQLCADEGKLASRAAAARLQYLDKHREECVVRSPTNAYYSGLTLMFRIIQAVGDADQEPVVAHFLDDKEKMISYYAQQAYPWIKAGLPWKWRIGY